MRIPRRLPLPEGYRVIEPDGTMALFDGEGRLLMILRESPEAAAALEECAWNDVWRHIHREIHEDLHALREGSRPLHDLQRLRQYLQMLDAVQRGRVEEPGPEPRRYQVAAALAVAASIAVLLFGISTSPLRLVFDPSRTPVETMPTAARPDEKTPPMRQTPAPRAHDVPAARGRGDARVAQTDVAARRPALPRTGKATRVPPAAQRRTVTGYVLNFGEFASHAAAEIHMRLIRSKGYIVHVARIGSSFQVITRPYATLEQAERIANALQQIGLPARPQKVPAREI